MKVSAEALGNLAYRNINSGDEDFGRSGYHDPRVDDGQVMACDEAMIALQITRDLALRKKRIVIDIVYPKPTP